MTSKTLFAALFAASLTFGAALAQDKAPAAAPAQKDAHKEHGDKEHKHEAKKDEKKAATKAKVGEAAPDFKLTDTDGKEVKLADFKDKIVVLEWFNPECPVVVDAYKKETMQKMKAEFKGDKNVVFLAINSGGPGKEGHGTAKNADIKKAWKIEHPILLDETGTVGKAYGATNTPHMFVIGKDGKLAYAGAIDDKKDKNYVTAAVKELLAGKPVTTAETKAYGCSVKYAAK